jgi:hypothetical protein
MHSIPVKLILTMEVTLDPGERSSRAWIDNEIVPPLAKELKTQIASFVRDNMRTVLNASVITADVKVLSEI